MTLRNFVMSVTGKARVVEDAGPHESELALTSSLTISRASDLAKPLGLVHHARRGHGSEVAKR
jgi:hypothetical protein